MPKTEKQTLAVYCGSSNKIDELFKTETARFGKLIGEAGYDVVYGGGHLGLMGIIADSAIEHGSDVIGVIPEHLRFLEKVHQGRLKELHVVDSMHERKQKMVDLADAFIILPGGLGTMDEFFEIFTWWQLGMHDKPIVICNLNGYWDNLLVLIDGIIAGGFAPADNKDYLIIVDTVDAIIDAVEKAPREKYDPKTKWI